MAVSLTRVDRFFIFSPHSVEVGAGCIEWWENKGALTSLRRKKQFAIPAHNQQIKTNQVGWKSAHSKDIFVQQPARCWLVHLKTGENYQFSNESGNINMMLHHCNALVYFNQLFQQNRQDTGAPDNIIFLQQKSCFWFSVTHCVHSLTLAS